MAEETKKQSEPTAVSDAELFAKAENLSAQAPARRWNKGKHIALIAWVAIQHGLDEDARRDFMASLAKQGLGGNASQFQKALAKKGFIDTEENALEEYN
jgi:hypothetical protein